MSVRLGTFFGLLYFAIAAWAVLCWMPQFFDLNYGTEAKASVRYVAATLIPLALLLFVVAFRQAKMGALSWTLLGMVLACAAFLLIALGRFYMVRPATVLSFFHILLAAVFIPLVLFHPGWNKQAAAE